ncbi:MAG: hypothetical protein HY360_22605 [Verrucomicrobia bacterium]|nr:hypothetical protein [Verrucomicrobiota bacterium]
MGSLACDGRVCVPQQSYVWSEKVHWKTGEAHHIAWTWSGRKRSLYLDGKIGKGQPNAGPLQGEGRVDTSENVVVEGWLHGDLTRAQLLIGRGHSSFTLDELRISSVARPLDEIRNQMNTAPDSDAYTLLLDHGEGGPADVISGSSGEKGGKLEGSHEIVPAKFGKGIKLWKE